MKTYVIAATILAIVGLLFGMYRAGYSQGKLATRTKYEQAALTHRERENELLVSLEKAKKERKIVYRQRNRVIGKANGDCLDRPLPESISRILHDSDGSEAKPATDDGL
jgi:hypothetical protein